MAKYDVQRATKQDIEKALNLISSALKLDRKMLEANLLGSTIHTLQGAKKDSGDIDIALSSDDISPEDADEKMMQLTKGQGVMNKGTKIGSYALDVGGKKIQIDLMFVNSKDWAKFMYHSPNPSSSKYPGVVRNLLLMAAVRFTQEAGKDLVVKNKDQVIARASRALKLDTGLERLFKIASKNEKTGKWSKQTNKVDPKELQKRVDAIIGKAVKFSHDPEIINEPDKVAAFIFGDGVTAKDIMTAEQVINQIKKLPNKTEILSAAKEDLQKANLPLPKEL